MVEKNIISRIGKMLEDQNVRDTKAYYALNQDPEKQKKSTSQPTDQHTRFLEAARELGCDESEEAAERIFTRLVPPRRPGDPLPQKPEPVPPAGNRGRPRKKG